MKNWSIPTIIPTIVPTTIVPFKQNLFFFKCKNSYNSLKISARKHPRNVLLHFSVQKKIKNFIKLYRIINP